MPVRGCQSTWPTPGRDEGSFWRIPRTGLSVTPPAPKSPVSVPVPIPEAFQDLGVNPYSAGRYTADRTCSRFHTLLARAPHWAATCCAATWLPLASPAVLACRSWERNRRVRCCFPARLSERVLFVSLVRYEMDFTPGPGNTLSRQLPQVSCNLYILRALPVWLRRPRTGRCVARLLSARDKADSTALLQTWRM